MTPQVSVIIPVYNSAGYVRDAVQSVRDQTIDPDEVEILAVDDGSTDGSGQLLAELAADDPRMTVITQENSGTAGGARNPAIDRAVGEFVFFLDSDDRLTPDALRRMVGTARSEGSDVVLGKIASSDARHAPASMFGRTVLDADLVEDKVFNTLGPTKLIRRDLIERLGLRFPVDQKVGEDQPFMAAVYLNARKISILADTDYYIIQHRDDGTNLTRTPQTAEAQLLIAVRLAQVIEEYTEPGPLRDALLRRPFGWTMKRVLDRRWTRLDRAEQTRLAGIFRDEIGHLLTDGARKHLAVDLRILLDLLGRGELEGLQTYSEHLASGAALRVDRRDGRFVRAVPAELETLIPVAAREVRMPKTGGRLEDVRLEGRRLTVTASVRMPEFDGAPDGLGIRARRRGREEFEDLRVTTEDLTVGGRSFAVTAVHDGLGRGIWDLFVVVRFGAEEREVRVGADRSRTIPPEGVSNLGDELRPEQRMIAYFTQGAGNLSIDSGIVMHRGLALARSVGMTPDENGRALLLVQLSSAPRAGDEFFAHLDAPHQHGGRQLLPALRLGDRLLGLRLPVGVADIGVSLTVTSVLGGASAPLPLTGSEHWPARATGFGFAGTEGGGLRVTAPAGSGRGQHALPGLQIPRPGPVAQGLRGRLVPVVKSLPIAGPALTRVVRAVRERRS